MSKNDAFLDKLDFVLKKYNALGQKLMDREVLSNKEYAEVSKEYSNMEDLANLINIFMSNSRQIEDLQSMIKSEKDQEVLEMVKEELNTLLQSVKQAEEEIKFLLLPKNKEDYKNAMLEIRAGTGGEEAALFGSVLLRMYEKYAILMGWKTEVMSYSPSDIGGIKEVVLLISGKNVFEKLKFESGVHRVQRVPETEVNGRIHTSAATVAVMPEAEDVDIEIKDEDLHIDTLRSGGAGGQHVNKTESAVRITHKPTGVVVLCQDDRSQYKNKEKAMKILRSKIYEMEYEKRQKQEASMRKSQIGTGDRSERIRTYNYPQGRVTDHRINLTLYKINEITDEGQLYHVVDELLREDRIARMTEI